MLKAGGYATVSAFDAMSGFASAVRERPSLVVVDISMPAGGGFSILERMKTFPALADIPTIVITATDDAASRERAAALGVAGFLIKPVDADALRTIVAETLPQA